MALHESVVHTLLSLQVTVLPTHVPFKQASLMVQALPSLHAAPLMNVLAHLAPTQVSAVQPFLSLQSAAVAQLPPQPTTAVKTHLPLAVSHESMVHASLSSHATGLAPMQAPAVQVSTVVQELPSLHGRPLVPGVTAQLPVEAVQVSLVQGLLSLQTTAVPKQTPDLQVSALVHRLLSLQAVPFKVVCTQALLVQASVVHALLSLHCPTLLHWLQVVAVKTQVPVFELQASMVQALLSLQTTALPAHLPVAQTSVRVQGSPSLHKVPFVTLANKQLAVAVSHESLVQALLSLQTLAMPGTHLAALHTSPAVHAFVSSHAVPSARPLMHLPAMHFSVVQTLPSLQSMSTMHCTPQPGMAEFTHLPLAVSQLSAVHASPSSQFLGLPPVHTPALQASTRVQGLVSSHGVLSAPAGAMHLPVAGSQASLVQGFLSSQTMAVPTHLPVPHASVVQGLPSLQGEPSALTETHLPVGVSHFSVVQMLLSIGQSTSALHGLVQLGMAENMHLPVTVSQLSVVQTSPSSQGMALPPHLPPVQASGLVQRLPSSQAVASARLAVRHLPVVLSHESVVQGLLSLHTAAAPETHLPAAHPSPTVHKSPSLQAVWSATAALTHLPVTGSHESAVHSLLSSQPDAVPGVHLPPKQLSLAVQALPSSQVAPSAGVTAHLPAVQVSFVQGLLSLQSADEPQLPPQPTMGLAMHVPLVESHKSFVQGSLSSQTMLVEVHWPALHRSGVVQALPSVQVAPSSLVARQPLAGSQLSLVQGFLSSQTTVAPAQVPAVQMSPLVQAEPSSQLLPSLGVE